MATFERIKLSGSTSGRGIKVAATSSTGTTIHATGTSASVYDEVWLWAYNSDTQARTLTIQFGGTSTPDDDIKVDIPPQAGLTLVVPGLTLTGTGSAAATVYAYCGTTNVVIVSGYVNRIS